jgi:hypothetical protein
MRYLKDAQGKLETWVKVVAVALSLLSGAVAYGKLVSTVSATTKTVADVQSTIITTEERLRKNEIEDATIHTALTVTLENVVIELRDIKTELKNGNAYQRNMYKHLVERDAAVAAALVTNDAEVARKLLLQNAIVAKKLSAADSLKLKALKK